jgi:hypothetical protein
MEYVTLTTVEDSYQAYFVRKALEDDGIRCIVANENMNNLFPLSGPLAILINIQVAKADEEVALNVLNKIRTDTDTVLCINCSSMNVKFGLGPKNRFKKLLFLAMAALFWVPVAKMHLVYYCCDCRTEFRKNRF